MGINAIAAIAAVLVVVIACAVFRVNLWTLLPWYPGPPRRYDDKIDELGVTRHSADEPDKRH